MPISDGDVEAIVRFVGQIAGMIEPPPERRRAVMEGLKSLVDADVWVWVHSAGWDVGNPMPIALLDGGWQDDAERTRVWHANTRSEWTDAYRRGMTLGKMETMLFDRHHKGWGDGSIYDQIIKPTGFEHLLFTMYPLPGGLYSGWGLHRRAGRSIYTPREVAIVHLVLGQLDWLHQHHPTAAAETTAMFGLTPRQREVLVHLLGGDSRKEIARKLSISEHTTNDYVKSIHKALDVRSRGELMAKFLPGSAA